MYNNNFGVVVVGFFTFVDMIFARGSTIGRLRRLSNVSMPFCSSVCFVPVFVQPGEIPVCLTFHKSHICILRSGAHVSGRRA